jgi:hypothetical protein
MRRDLDHDPELDHIALGLLCWAGWACSVILILLLIRVLA